MLALAVIAVASVGTAVAATVATHAEITGATAIADSSEYERIIVHAGDVVPTDGAAGAFGYGVLSSAGLDAIIVTTTHGGVLDSIAQEDASDASFHNHYVRLADIKDDSKCPGLEVVDISWQQPGDVDVEGYTVTIEDAPYYFGATHSLTNDHISFQADGEAANAVYFTINPVNGRGHTSITDIAAVCINDVSPVDISVVPASYWEGN